MKHFADDYVDKIGTKMQMIRRSVYLYELLPNYSNFGWRPSWDIYETAKDLVVLVEVAGIQEKDVEIEVGREYIQLRGNRCRPSDRDVTRIHHMEIGFGSYHQVIALPEVVDPGGATSSYRDGFLLIRLPKKAESYSPDSG